MSEGTPPPYRSGLATGFGLTLLAGLVLALADVVHTGGAPLQVLALWSVLALLAGLGLGLVLAAGNATWGPGWVRRLFARLRDDAELDRNVAAIIMSAAVLAPVLIFATAKLSIGLVGETHRKNIGGLLLGVVVVGLIPALAIGGLPIYRVTRRIAALVPVFGPVSRVVLLLAIGLVGIPGAGLFVIFTNLDHQALSLGTLLAPALLPVIAVAIAIVAFGPLASLRERIPRRGTIVAAATAFAVLLPFVALRAPSEDTVVAITDRSYIGPRAVPALRKLIDRDGDGYSAFFGGPDCNDSDKNVNPDALDIPDDGIDQNCDGFDNTTAAKPPELPVAEQPATTLRGGDNLLVIFVDTLRYDRLGFTGYKRDGKSLTPRLDAFAAQSVVFERAYAQAPNTPRSVPSFLTSRYPSQLEVDDSRKNYPMNLDGNEFLFEVLKPAGFKTYGMSSHFYFCDHAKYPDTCADVKNTDGTPMRTNAIQGADEWDNREARKIYDKNGGPDSNNDFAGPRIIAKTKQKLDELATSKQKFAMLVHLFEPHSSYIKHPEFPITERGTASLVQRYDYEIAVEDRLIGELLDHLDATGLTENTTVVLVSDHGEAFGVHSFAGEKQFFHGMTLYTEVLHVPLIFRVPGAKPRVVSEVVQLIDLAPTIAALFGVEKPASWVGRSLVPALEGQPLAPMPAFAEMLPSKSWNHAARSMVSADGRYHVFHRVSDGRWEIYDLVEDPEERKNIVGSLPNAKELQQQLASWAQSLGSGGAP